MGDVLDTLLETSRQNKTRVMTLPWKTGLHFSAKKDWPLYSTPLPPPPWRVCPLVVPTLRNSQAHRTTHALPHPHLDGKIPNLSRANSMPTVSTQLAILHSFSNPSSCVVHCSANKKEEKKKERKEKEELRRNNITA